MTRLFAKKVTSDAAADSAQKAPLAFAHGRCFGVIVGRVGVAGLWCELMLLLLLGCVVVVGWLLLVLAGCHALLVGLVLRVGVIVAVLWSGGTVVAGVSLRIARFIGAVLMALDAHLESPMLRRAEAVRPSGRGKSLILVAAAL